MKPGGVLALAVTALLMASAAEACSMSGPRNLSRAEIAQQGAEFARADSVYIARGRRVGVSMCGSVYAQVPAVALKNGLPRRLFAQPDGQPFTYGADYRGDDRIVIFARRVRFSEDWRRWGKWQIIAHYGIESITHPRVRRALNGVAIPSFVDTTPPPPRQVRP